MNEHDRAELERLKVRQEALRTGLVALDVDIERLSARLNEARRLAPEIHSPEPPLSEMAPPFAEQTATEATRIPQRTVAAEPPPLPPVIALALSSEASTELPAPFRKESHEFIPPIPPPVPRPRETLEMKLGTYWLVRVGIVMLLTGLVFLGTYAYKNFIGNLGPAGKVTLLYTASAALLAFGGWLQRKREKESLRNYGQVLFAGGLAAVYFTTYAAHHVEVLRVIANPVFDALLLMAWSAFTVWIADRRKSEVLALFAVGLSYYTSAITDIGYFTLGSNLLLTAAAVLFLVRNQWTKLSFISVIATYGGFIFWRLHQGDWTWDARIDQLWNANFFLAGYWLFFTAAVFLARGKSLTRAGRALFASLNNGAFFALVVLSMFHVGRGNFWKFSLGFGVVLLAAAFAARRFFSAERTLPNTYIVQGLTLATAGLIAYFTGLQLALVLAAESVVLTILGGQQKNPFVRAGGYITAALSAAWVLALMKPVRTDVWLGSAIGVAFLVDAWWEQRHDAAREKSAIRPGSGYFVALAIFICGVVTWHAVPEQWRAVAWMTEAIVLTALFYALRISELPPFAQALAVAAQGYWFFEFALKQSRPHWAVPAGLIAGTLALSHWWQRQKRLVLAADLRNVLQIVYALALTDVLFFWFKPGFGPAAWLAFLNVLAIGLTVYGVVTRVWALAACAQVFLLISSVEFFQQFLGARSPWQFALVPIATWLALGIATTAYLSHRAVGTREEVRRPLLHVSTFYRSAAFFMSLWWIFEYVPAARHFWVVCALGVGLLLPAGLLKKSREALVFSGLYLAVALAAWFINVSTDDQVIHWANALAMLAILAGQQLVRRWPQRYRVPAAVDSAAVLLTGVALWTFVSRWVVLKSGEHFLLTVSWAGLAAGLFALGFVLRERMHRWLGLGILMCAVGRVFISDVWKLHTLYRILSFMALGIVLLALGFVYNKYQEKIRQWL